MSGTGWGWTPTAPAVPIPPSSLAVRIGDGLQEAVDALPAGGGTLELAGGGTLYADPSSPATELALNKPVRFIGQSMDTTIIGSPILQSVGRCGYEHLTVRPPAGAYGIKIFNSGVFLSRSWFKHVFVGASSDGAGDGPVLGVVFDGAGVLKADQLTIAFCTSHGLLVDSTAAEPNTTLLMDCCSFNVNGGYGVRCLQSLTCAEFNGGNMEDNDLGELYAQSVNGLHLSGVDFERGLSGSPPSVGNIIEFDTVLHWTIDKCNFAMSGGTATRGLLVSAGAGGYLGTCRWEGWSNQGIIRIGETARNIRVAPQRIVTTTNWIEDYSY